MEAPNKIYVDDLAVVNDCSTRISTKPLSDFSEYIRKDLLLEWAKAKKAELLNEELTDVAAGINMGMDMLIYKLKQL